MIFSRSVFLPFITLSIGDWYRNGKSEILKICKIRLAIEKCLVFRTIVYKREGSATLMEDWPRLIGNKSLCGNACCVFNRLSSFEFCFTL